MKDALGDSDDEGKAGGGDGAEEGALPALSDSEGEGEKKEEVETKLPLFTHSLRIITKKLSCRQSEQIFIIFLSFFQRFGSISF